MTKCCICKAEAETEIKEADNKKYIGKPICNECEGYRTLLRYEPPDETDQIKKGKKK